MPKKKVTKETISKADRAKLKEYAELTKPGPIMKIEDLNPLEQMELVDKLYEYFTDLFKEQGKRRLMAALKSKEHDSLVSDDTLNIDYKWCVSVGVLWVLRKYCCKKGIKK